MDYKLYWRSLSSEKINSLVCLHDWMKNSIIDELLHYMTAVNYFGALASDRKKVNELLDNVCCIVFLIEINY